MTVVSMCRSLQAPPISRPQRVVRSSSSRSSSSGSGRLQQPAHVVSLRGNLSQLATNSRITSASTFMGSGTGVAGSVRWRSSRTSTTTYMLQESPGLGADERSSLIVEHNFEQARHIGKAGASAAVAASPCAAPSTTEDIAVAAPRLAPRPATTDVKLIDIVRGVCFTATSYSMLALTIVVQIIMHPFVLAFDRQHRIAHFITSKTWAQLATSMFYKTEVVGRENLPPAEEGPVVFVANHQSFMDHLPMYHLDRPFKFVSKRGNYWIPFLGVLKYLNGYVAVVRTDPMSQFMCMKACMNLLKEGISVVFFPEGTTAHEGTLLPFKKGAFTVAAKGGVPVVPVTIIGTGRLKPKGFNHILRSGNVRVVIHPPIRNKSADELCDQSRKIIAETMLMHGLPVHAPVSTQFELPV